MELKGKIIGFEENTDYVMEAPFGEDSPFRVLACTTSPISFAVVNPFHVIDNYSFEVDDNVIDELELGKDAMESISVLSIVRHQEKTLFVNLRSPLIINTKSGRFKQVVLSNEAYGVSVAFAARREE